MKLVRKELQNNIVYIASENLFWSLIYFNELKHWSH